MHKAAVLFFAMCVSGLAQWPAYATPGIPRKADGKPDLAAPAPKTHDGKPDLSGVWRIRQTSYLIYAMGDMKPEEMRPWAAAFYREQADKFRNNTDGIACLPPGPKAGLSGGAFPMKILQTPNEIAILYEYQTIYRQIFTDGRSLPKDPNPTWMGYSVGHWEGDTLVATTAGFNDRTTLDLGGHPHSEELRVTERFHRRDVGHMDVQVTLEDPKAYTRPWTLPVELELMPDSELIEYVCENERDAPHLVGKRGDEAQIPLEVLKRYVGTYVPANAGFASSSGRPLGRNDILLEGNRLMIQPEGFAKIPLFAQSENKFSMEGTEIEFVKDASGAVTGMVQHWTEGDRVSVLKR